MNQLILCEKPSVSAIVAHAVGAKERIFDDAKKNFCYSGNGYYVAHARGHLYGVGMPQDYGYSKNYKIASIVSAVDDFRHKDEKPPDNGEQSIVLDIIEDSSVHLFLICVISGGLVYAKHADELKLKEKK